MGQKATATAAAAAVVMESGKLTRGICLLSRKRDDNVNKATIQSHSYSHSHNRSILSGGTNLRTLRILERIWKL